MKKIIFFTLSLISINSFAGNDLSLVCEGQNEFYEIPKGESIVENQKRSYVFIDGALKESSKGFPIKSKYCKWSDTSITCFYDSSVIEEILVIDRLTTSISHTVTNRPSGYKPSVANFKGNCKAAKQKF